MSPAYDSNAGPARVVIIVYKTVPARLFAGSGIGIRESAGAEAPSQLSAPAPPVHYQEASRDELYGTSQQPVCCL